jgi:catechol 2,3-dioxygenase-like lactoylglutathione lyase family enzyme
LRKKIAPDLLKLTPHEISLMTLQLRRVILFTPNLAEMEDFYPNVLGLEATGREGGWVNLSTGPCSIALHAGSSKVGARPPKLAFYAADVSGTRAARF